MFTGQIDQLSYGQVSGLLISLVLVRDLMERSEETRLSY